MNLKNPLKVVSHRPNTMVLFKTNNKIPSPDSAYTLQTNAHKKLQLQ